MRKATQAIGFIAGAAFAASLLVWCGGVPGAQGEAPDAGGSTTCDCPAPKEPLVVEAQCDKEYLRERSASGEGNAYYAEVAVAGLDPAKAPVISAVTCDPVCANSEDARCQPKCALPVIGGGACPEGLTTTPRCTPAEVVVREGKVLVPCGIHGYDIRSSGQRVDFDFKYSRVVVRVD